MRQANWTHTITVFEIRDGGQRWISEPCRLLKNHIVTQRLGRFSHKTGNARGQIGARMMGAAKCVDLTTLVDLRDKPTVSTVPQNGSKLFEEQARILASLLINTRRNIYIEAGDLGYPDPDDADFAYVERVGSMFHCEECGYFLPLAAQSGILGCCNGCAIAIEDTDEDTDEDTE
jgi:hypothetical protein